MNKRDIHYLCCINKQCEEVTCVSRRDYERIQSNIFIENEKNIGRLYIATKALEQLSEGWMYWPTKEQPNPDTIRYTSRTVDEIERMAKQALKEIQNGK